MNSLKKLEESIISFVNKPTVANFALMLDGKWGSGKTHFIQEVLFPTLHKQTSNRPALYVSLNGVNSFEEIYEQLTAEKFRLIKLVNTKVGKVTWGIIKTALNITLKTVKQDSVDTHLDRFNIKLEDVANFSNNVIVFDDLERIGKKLSIEDLFGFINTNFVEHNTTKVIIVGWEEELIKRFNTKTEKKDYDEVYKKAKNKIVNWTLAFKNNLSEVIENLIKVYEPYSKEKTALKQDFYDRKFYSFLKKYEKFIIDRVIKSEEENLRHILFFMDSLRSIFSVVERVCKEDYSVKQVILSLLIVCLEFKKNILEDHPFIYKDLDERYLLTLKQFAEDQENKDLNDTTSYLKDFERKYTPITNFWKFDSIINLVKYGEFDTSLFAKEILPYLKKTAPEKLAFENLLRIHMLSDSEYLQTLETVYKAVEKDKYLFTDLLVAFGNLLTLQKANIYIGKDHNSLYKLFSEKILSLPESKFPSLSGFNKTYFNNLFNQIKSLGGEKIITKIEERSEELEIVRVRKKKQKIFDLVSKDQYDKVTISDLLFVLKKGEVFKTLKNNIIPHIENKIFFEKIRDTIQSMITNQREYKKPIKNLKEGIENYLKKINSEKKPITSFRLNKLLNDIK